MGFYDIIVLEIFTVCSCFLEFAGIQKRNDDVFFCNILIKFNFAFCMKMYMFIRIIFFSFLDTVVVMKYQILKLISNE